MRTIFFIFIMLNLFPIWAQVEINHQNYIAEYDRPYLSHYAIDSTLPRYYLPRWGTFIDAESFMVNKSGNNCRWDFSSNVFTYPLFHSKRHSLKDTFSITKHLLPTDLPTDAEKWVKECLPETEFIIQQISTDSVFFPPPFLTGKEIGYGLYELLNEDYVYQGGYGMMGGTCYNQKKPKGLPYYYGRSIIESFDTVSSRSLPVAKEYLTRRRFYGVDGQGELILPYGTIRGAIKLTDATVEVLTRVYNNGNITVDTQDVAAVYNWYHPLISNGIPIVEGYFRHVYYQLEHTRPHRNYYLYMLKQESIKDELAALEQKQLSEEEFGNFDSHLRLYPNPAGHKLHWVYGGTDTPNRLRVLDLRGSLWYDIAQLDQKSSGQLDLQTLPTGVYVLELSGEGFTQRKRFVKQ